MDISMFLSQGHLYELKHPYNAVYIHVSYQIWNITYGKWGSFT